MVSQLMMYLFFVLALTITFLVGYSMIRELIVYLIKKFGSK